MTQFFLSINGDDHIPANKRKMDGPDLSHGAAARKIEDDGNHEQKVAAVLWYIECWHTSNSC